MDANIQRLLHDKLYEKRKNGALELEKLVRDSLAADNHERIKKIVDQLCHDYAYAIHQPYARNGGLIGLAAASIALGSDGAQYLEEIVPPVLACFSDQDARVRYYACESMYNIAKTTKGEILPFFNEVFDALAKLAADSELSVKNGAELLDRLVKDIVSESAASYVSVVHPPEKPASYEKVRHAVGEEPVPKQTAFSLSRFIPLLQERIFVLNPFTRMFLVQWITLLDSIPDLELVTYLPSFLGGLFRFLNDSNQDVVTATQHALERFLEEIKLVARIKRDLNANHRLSMQQGKPDEEDDPETPAVDPSEDANPLEKPSNDLGDTKNDEDGESAISLGEESDGGQEDWIPGQDVQVDHAKILETLTEYLQDSSESVQLTVLRWIDSFFDICPDDMIGFVPVLLNHVLAALSSDSEQVRKAGARVNESLVDYIVSITDEEEKVQVANKHNGQQQRLETQVANDAASSASREPSPKPRVIDESQKEPLSLDYDASVNALTRQFLNENEATRAAALSWLLMLQRKAPKKVLAAHDGTFPALLKTLADTSDTVVTRDLQLLCQISKYSDDSYFSFFMVNLLKLFDGDRRLLETRGNLIIRQLCLNLSPERIYRTMADCLEKSDDPEFTSIMVQNLNNNLITAPELADLRKKMRNWDTKEGQTLFVALFRAWCHNAVATISLCLLAQAYEQAYNILQIFADIEMTVNMLIQIDKLVQLLESPVFTFLRLQLLEPERFPYLYKCLYGILMLLPQSAAFAALKNRLNSVSASGYLHIPQASGPRGSVSGPTGQNTSAFERPPGRLKSREDGPVRWTELLEKFRNVQDKARRSSRVGTPTDEEGQKAQTGMAGQANGLEGAAGRKMLNPAEQVRRTLTSPSLGTDGNAKLPTLGSGPPAATPAAREHKSRFSASHFGKLTGGVKGKSKK